jgi:hypothetical protein
MTTNTLPTPEIQRGKPRKGRSKVSCVMKDSSNSLIAQLDGVLPDNTLNVPGSEAETRRSARPIVPSKRCDQMNQIGSKNTTVIFASIGKENIPCNSRPNWAIAAQDHLLGMELGAEWTACVHHWVELEEILGYGTIAGSRVRPFIGICHPQYSNVLMHHRQHFRLSHYVLRSGLDGWRRPVEANAHTEIYHSSTIQLNSELPSSSGGTQCNRSSVKHPKGCLDLCICYPMMRKMHLLFNAQDPTVW